MRTGNHRDASIAVCLAGLEATALAPLLIWAYGRSTLPVFSVMLGLWALQCLWVIAVGVLNSMDLDDTAYRWRVVAAILISSLLLVRAVVYPRVTLGDLSWLAATWVGVFDLNEGVPLELLSICTNILLWQRALTQSGSHTPYPQLSRLVRWLWVLAALGATAVAAVPGASPLPALIVGFPLGLLVLMMSRADEKEGNAASLGPAPALGGSLQLLLVVLVISALGILPIYSVVRSVSPWVEKAFSLLLLLGFQIVMAFVFLVYPLIVQAVEWVMGLVRAQDAAPLIEMPSHAELFQGESPVIRTLMSIPPWTVAVLRIVALLLLVAVVIGFMMLLGRLARPNRRSYTDGQRAQRTTTGGSLLVRGMAQLQDLLDMARRVGIGHQLLSAISVQNIYANLSRLAAARGHPRQPFQPPDGYVQELTLAFGGHEEALQRITVIYMRVHYGDYDIAREDLRQVQEDYRTIRKDLS